MGSSLRKLPTVGLVVLMLGILIGLFQQEADAGPHLIIYPMPSGTQPAPYNVSGSSPQVSASFFPIGTGSLGSVLTPIPFPPQQNNNNNLGNLLAGAALNNLLNPPLVVNAVPVVGGVGGKVIGGGLAGMYGGW